MRHFKPNIFIKELEKPFGLSYFPTLEPEILDSCTCFSNYKPYQYKKSDNSLEVLNIVTEEVLHAPLNILEIGVSLYDRELTITDRLIKDKPENSKYIGIDISDRSFVKSWGKDCFFIQENSGNFDSISDKINNLNIENFGIIVIDGDHSLNGILKDWRYIKFLHKSGSVLIHDSNTHPGPVALIESIDRKIFNVFEPLNDKYDHGITVVKYKNE